MVELLVYEGFPRVACQNGSVLKWPRYVADYLMLPVYYTWQGSFAYLVIEEIQVSLRSPHSVAVDRVASATIG